MEEYKNIIGFSKYQVSNFGNVKNIKSGKILNQRIHNGYKVMRLSNDSNIVKDVSVHRLIAIAFLPNPNNKPCVDHIDNNDTTNNNISNLRWATNSQNNMNRGVSKNNTSGYKGIYFHKKSNKWVARIKMNGNYIQLGYYENVDDAIKARLEAVIQHHGEYANQVEKDLIINLKIKVPPKRNIVINLNIQYNDEEYKALEQEFEDAINDGDDF